MQNIYKTGTLSPRLLIMPRTYTNVEDVHVCRSLKGGPKNALNKKLKIRFLSPISTNVYSI